jgi:TPR repeat protein
MMVMRDYELKQLENGIKAFENEEFSLAFTILIPLAKAGDAKAQCYIATMYQGGFGVPVDGYKAVEWYLLAAKQEENKERVSATAYNNLGTIYSTGMPGMPAHKSLAKEYWRKAAELGFEMIPSEWYKN